jgi:hypothetical protein
MLVSLPKGRKLVFCKRVFKIKHGVNGKGEHCKARPMTIGFTQTYGVHYNETFPLVAKFMLIHYILAFAMIENMKIHQMDIKTTFLNASLLKRRFTWNNPKDSYKKEANILCVSFTNPCMA